MTLRLNAPEPPRVDQVRRTTNRTLGWVVGLGILGLCLVMVIPAMIIPSLIKDRPTPSSSPGPLGVPAMASSTSCLSNLKQVTVAALIYQSDYDDRMPQTTAYKLLLMPYTKNASVFYCPDTGTMFGMNDKLVKVDSKKIKDPVNTVYFFDAKGKTISYVHSGQAHVSFTDGHVKTVSSKVVLKLNP